MTGRALVGRAAIRAVEKAMEVVGGASLYRDLGLERRFRDIQAPGSIRCRKTRSIATPAETRSAFRSTDERRQAAVE
jgi:alkylation response protein AidB-like acyl-CoA dehydrogenase